MPSLNDLVDYLTRKNIHFRRINETEITFSLKFYSYAGSPHIVELEVHQINDVLQVRATHNRYPKLCPNRHINFDGWFCLGLREDLETLSIDQWIQNVKEFLDAQHQCEINGIWPHNVGEWAHGDGSIYQKIVEQYYGQFKNNILGLTLEQLKVEELESSDHTNEKIDHVYADGKLILVGSENLVLNKHFPCACDEQGLEKYKSLGKCPENCAEVIFKVAVNDYLLHKAEKEFWDSFIKCGWKTCCNTMKKCEFKKEW